MPIPGTPRQSTTAPTSTRPSATATSASTARSRTRSRQERPRPSGLASSTKPQALLHPLSREPGENTMTKKAATFYHAGCDVCLDAEQELAAALDPSRYE